MRNRALTGIQDEVSTALLYELLDREANRRQPVADLFLSTADTQTNRRQPVADLFLLITRCTHTILQPNLEADSSNGDSSQTVRGS